MKHSIIGKLCLVICLYSTDSWCEEVQTKVTSQADAAKCPFSLGNLCFYPAVGAMYGAKSAGEKYKDLRFAAVLHSKVESSKRHSFGAMVAPGENFIDAAGFGGAYAFIQVEPDKYAVLNYGVMAKRHKIEGQEDDIRGGVYLLLSYSF